MEEQSDTPETDAAEREDAGPITHARRGWNYSRKHERERDAAIREIGEQARLLGISGSREMALLAKVDSITRERDEARAIANDRDAMVDHRDRALTAMYQRVDVITQERDEARAEVERLRKTLDEIATYWNGSHRPAETLDAAEWTQGVAEEALAATKAKP